MMRKSSQGFQDFITLIGVNNRNLKTFEVDLMNAVRLRKDYDGNQIFIAESGIKSSADMII